MSSTKKYLLIIEGDVNDADYTNQQNILTEKEYLKLKPMLEKFSKVYKQVEYAKSHTIQNIDYVEAGYLTQKEWDSIDDYFPHSNNDCEVHTITSIIVYEINSTKTIL